MNNVDLKNLIKQQKENYTLDQAFYTDDYIFDCNGTCAPANWLGDGFCDDGSYQNNQGEDIFFNCEEFNNDNGDCDAQGRTTQTRPYPNGRIKIQ